MWDPRAPSAKPRSCPVEKPWRNSLTRAVSWNLLKLYSTSGSTFHIHTGLLLGACSSTSMEEEVDTLCAACSRLGWRECSVSQTQPHGSKAMKRQPARQSLLSRVNQVSSCRVSPASGRINLARAEPTLDATARASLQYARQPGLEVPEPTPAETA